MAKNNAQRQADYRARQKAFPKTESDLRMLLIDAYYLGRADKGDGRDGRSTDSIVEAVELMMAGGKDLPADWARRVARETWRI